MTTGLITLALLCLLIPWLPTRPARAADLGEVRFTITAPIVNLRDQPSLLAPETVQVFKGQFYTVVGRNADGTWLQLDTYTGDDSGTWILAAMGAVVKGKLGDAAVIRAYSPSPAGRVWWYPDWIPSITPAQKLRYRQSVNYGKDLHMFTAVGDCNSLPSIYLQRVATGDFDPTGYPSLQTAVAQFAPSFTRVSLAVNGGFNAAAMMDPDWADHGLCDRDAGPFACEVWVSRASVVFIEVGTGDQYTWKSFEKNYRPLIEHALKKGVLPVLVTKADDLEARNGAPSGYINDVIRKLADEYAVPLLDFWQATRQLPNNGLLYEGGLNFHLNPAGRNLHLVATLQTLDAIMR